MSGEWGGEQSCGRARGISDTVQSIKIYNIYFKTTYWPTFQNLPIKFRVFTPASLVVFHDSHVWFWMGGTFTKKIKDKWECAGQKSREEKLNWRWGSKAWVKRRVVVFGSTHAHRGLIVPLQDGGHVSGLLLFLLCVVLNQRRPLGGPAPSFPRRLARRRRSVSSSFALGGPAA